MSDRGIPIVRVRTDAQSLPKHRPERDAHIVGRIERGLADVGSGRLVAHDAAMDELDDAVERAISR